MFRLLPLLASFSLLLALGSPSPAHAAPEFKGFVPHGACPTGEGTFDNDDCKTADVFIWIFIHWGNFMIGGAGAFALFFFVVGGFMMMISAGRAEMVQRGRAILIGSVIGLIIVFAAQLFVSFFLKTLLEGSKDAKAVNNQTELPVGVEVK